MTDKRGVLHLIPVPLGGENAIEVLAAAVIETAKRLEYFIVENEKSARRFLRMIEHPVPLRELKIECFDQWADSARAERLLAPIDCGRHAGVLSEAGCPAIADPGTLLVAAAHRHGLRVVPHVGPNSLVLALMASGCNGQRFQFHGYLPVARDACRAKLRQLEANARNHDRTEIFIETPYRNDALLACVLETCSKKVTLCIASDLTLPTEEIRRMSVLEWQREKIMIGRKPSVFLLGTS